MSDEKTKEVFKFRVIDLETAHEFIAAITEMNQPIYVYTSPTDDVRRILVSTKQLTDAEAESLFAEMVLNDTILDADEPVWEDGEDIDLDWLIM